MSTSAQHPSPTHHAFWPCSQSAATVCSKCQAPNCACIDVLHIWAVCWNWAHVLWLQCTSVTRSVCQVAQLIYPAFVSHLLMCCIGLDAMSVCLEIFTRQPIVVALCSLLASCHSQPNTLHPSAYSVLLIVHQACLSVTLDLSFIYPGHLWQLAANLTTKPHVQLCQQIWLPAAQYMTWRQTSPQRDY